MVTVYALGIGLIEKCYMHYYHCYYHYLAHQLHTFHTGGRKATWSGEAEAYFFI